MEKIAVIYWSQGGNTEMMANAVAEGAKAAGADVSLLHVNETDAVSAAGYGKLALGCPWARRFWRKRSSSRSLRNWNPGSAVKRSHCLAPMAGVTANGCGIG